MCIEMSRFLCLIATSGPSLPFPGPPKISKRGTSLETGSTRAHGPRMIINQSCSKNGKYLLELAQSISSLCTSYESYCVLNVTESTELFLCLAPMSEDFRTGSTIQPFMNAAKSYMRVVQVLDASLRLTNSGMSAFSRDRCFSSVTISSERPLAVLLKVMFFFGA